MHLKKRTTFDSALKLPDKVAGRQDSNPQPSVLETDALPVELLPTLSKYTIGNTCGQPFLAENHRIYQHIGGVIRLIFDRLAQWEY